MLDREATDPHNRCRRCDEAADPDQTDPVDRRGLPQRPVPRRPVAGGFERLRDREDERHEIAGNEDGNGSRDRPRPRQPGRPGSEADRTVEHRQRSRPQERSGDVDNADSVQGEDPDRDHQHEQRHRCRDSKHDQSAGESCEPKSAPADRERVQ